MEILALKRQEHVVVLRFLGFVNSFTMVNLIFMLSEFGIKPKTKKYKFLILIDRLPISAFTGLRYRDR